MQTIQDSIVCDAALLRLALLLLQSASAPPSCHTSTSSNSLPCTTRKPHAARLPCARMHKAQGQTVRSLMPYIELHMGTHLPSFVASDTASTQACTAAVPNVQCPTTLPHIHIIQPSSRSHSPCQCLCSGWLPPGNGNSCQ